MSAANSAGNGAGAFRFLRRGYDPMTGVAELVYALGDGPELVETFTFPYAPWPPEPSRQEAFQGALELLHLIAGVSYYKAQVPARMEGPDIPPHLAGFLRQLYVHGLAEFAHINEIDLASRVNFESMTAPGSNPDVAPQELVLPDRALVAMGGGKDSLVALDILRQHNIEVQPICVGGSSLIEDTVRAAGLPLIRVQRTLAPELEQMNRNGAFNGHVPVTAINSAVLLCAAILYGFRFVVFANERSANEATLEGAKGAVNHQYSKSSEFEAGFRSVIARHVSPDIEYFSILRPLSELDIARRFAALEQYHAVFSSCNRNFHLDGSRNTGRWCGGCPKCRFTALALGLYLSPESVARIQGADLLDDPEQLPGFRALCALGADKPFECVGEAGESRAALKSLSQDPQWQHHAVVASLAPELEAVEVPEMETLLTPSPNHHIPPGLFAG